MKTSKILTTFFLAALASAAACGSDEPTKSNPTTTATGTGGAGTGGAGGAGGAGGVGGAGGAAPGLGIDAAPEAAVAASVDFAKPVSTSIAAGPFVFTLFEDKDCGLLDLTDPEAPLDRGVIATPARIVTVAYDEGNQLAYLASAEGDIHVIDLSDVEQPTERAKLTVSSLKGGLTGLTRVGDRLFALAGNLLQPLAIEREPGTKTVTKLALQAPLTLAEPATLIESGGGNLFLGDAKGTLQILSAPADSTKPAVLGQLGLGGPIKGLVVRGSKVLGIANGVGLKAVDFVDAKAPKILFESDEVKDASDVRLFGRTLVLGLDRGAVTTLDISKIDAPRSITTNKGKLPLWMAISRGQLFFGDKAQGKVLGIPPFIGGRLAGPTLKAFPLKGYVPITFSKDIDIATVNPESVKLLCGGQAVEGSPAVLPDQHSLIFRPSAPLAAGVSCKLDVSGVRDRLGNAVSAGGEGATLEFTTDQGEAKPVVNQGSKFKHTNDGKFTDLVGDKNPGEWSDVTPAKGMYTHFYADFDGSKLWLMNDWFYGGENIEPDCYNQFNVWTGGGSEQWDVRAYGDQHVEVRKNGVLVDPKEGGIEGGASYAASPNLAEPHTMYEIAVPASPGGWGVQLHDPGPTFNCHVLEQEPHPMQGTLSAEGDTSTTTIDLAQPEPPKAIELQFPMNQMTMAPPVKLMWNAGDGFDFTMYQVQVSTDESFAYKSRILDVGTYLSAVDIPSNLLKEGKTYYWHVIAWNTAGSTTSEAYSFTMMGGGSGGNGGGGGSGGTGGWGGGTTSSATTSTTTSGWGGGGTGGSGWGGGTTSSTSTSTTTTGGGGSGGGWGGFALSCEGGAPGQDDCGPGSESCCTSLLVPGGTVQLDATHTATVSDFRLDKYEVTVGRFRGFVDAWVGGWRPAAGAGKHTHLNGGQGLSDGASGFEPGWDPTWNASLGATKSAWDTNLACHATYKTWTSAAGANEKRPVNCATWFEQYAFCIWDGGFLPSEAEWQYAAAGGSEGRQYPWGTTTPTDAMAVFCGGSCSSTQNVGNKAAGNGRWGQSDLAGNVWEWTLDWAKSPYPLSASTNYANMTVSSNQVSRGGGFGYDASYLLASRRDGGPPTNRYYTCGARCARTP